MQRNIFARGVRFKLEGHTYEIQKELPEDKYELRDVDYGYIYYYYLNQLHELYNNGLLRFPLRGKNAYITGTDGKQIENSITSISNLSQDEQDLIIRKYEAIKPLLNVKSGTLSAALEVQKEKTGFSTSSLRRYLKNYINSGESLISLIKNFSACGRPTETRIPKIVENIIEEVMELYKKGEFTSEKEGEIEAILRIDRWNENQPLEHKLTYPSRSTIRRRMQKCDIYEVIKNRLGARAAFNELGYVEVQKKPSNILERVECDHTPLDIWVVDLERGVPLGRPWLTMLRDCCSGYILGMHIGFAPPSFLSVSKALRHAILPKTDLKKTYPELDREWIAYGLPKLLVVDNGKEFHSKSFTLACSELNIPIYYCPVKQPHYKGSVERQFRTTNSAFKALPGSTYAELFKKDGYNPKKHAVISLETLKKILHIWVLEVYSEDNNTGVKGIPKKIWEHSVSQPYNQPALPESVDALEIILGKVQSRTMQRTGIKYQHLDFQSKQLHAIFLEKKKTEKTPRIQFKYDPEDLGQIYVYDEYFEKRYITIPCMDQEYSKGMAEYTHKKIREISRLEFGRVDKSTMAKAREKIMNLIKEDKKKFNKTRREQYNINRIEESIDNFEKKQKEEISETSQEIEEVNHTNFEQWGSFTLDFD